jgi:hypothetical protein
MSKEYITKSEAIEAACNAVELFPSEYQEIENAINRVVADVAPVRHGEWMERACRPTCSLCGFSGSLIDTPISPFKYCPNCGAKMDGGTP